MFQLFRQMLMLVYLGDPRAAAAKFVDVSAFQKNPISFILKYL
jgi:hypothetical protein